MRSRPDREVLMSRPVGLDRRDTSNLSMASPKLPLRGWSSRRCLGGIIAGLMAPRKAAARPPFLQEREDY